MAVELAATTAAEGSGNERDRAGFELPPVERWERRPGLVSVVCPVYREVDGIGFFTDRLLEVLDGLGFDYEVLFVEDDSPDRTIEALRELHGRRPDVIRVLALSRRFGHQASLAAGFLHARGDVVICMDSDMQHPPAQLPVLLYRWSQGYQLVYTRRRRQEGRGVLKEAASRWFYRLMDRLADVQFEEGTADFRLMDRVVVDALNRFGEVGLVYRGLVNWIGFERTVVEYEAPRRHAGTSSYSWGRMLRMGVDALFAFSLVPLRFSLVIGAVMMVLCWVYGAVTVIGHIVGWFDAPGYTSLVLLVLFLGSLNLIFLGTVGEYVGRIHRQVKQRPIFLVKESIGFGEPSDRGRHDRES